MFAPFLGWFGFGVGVLLSIGFGCLRPEPSFSTVSIELIHLSEHAEMTPSDRLLIPILDDMSPLLSG
jgi:hypothetical protein